MKGYFKHLKHKIFASLSKNFKIAIQTTCFLEYKVLLEPISKVQLLRSNLQSSCDTSCEKNESKTNLRKVR